MLESSTDQNEGCCCFWWQQEVHKDKNSLTPSD